MRQRYSSGGSSFLLEGSRAFGDSRYVTVGVGSVVGARGLANYKLGRECVLHALHLLGYSASTSLPTLRRGQRRWADRQRGTQRPLFGMCRYCCEMMLFACPLAPRSYDRQTRVTTWDMRYAICALGRTSTRSTQTTRRSQQEDLLKGRYQGSPPVASHHATSSASAPAHFLQPCSVWLIDLRRARIISWCLLQRRSPERCMPHSQTEDTRMPTQYSDPINSGNEIFPKTPGRQPRLFARVYSAGRPSHLRSLSRFSAAPCSSWQVRVGFHCPFGRQKVERGAIGIRNDSLARYYYVARRQLTQSPPIVRLLFSFCGQSPFVPTIRGLAAFSSSVFSHVQQLNQGVEPSIPSPLRYALFSASGLSPPPLRRLIITMV